MELEKVKAILNIFDNLIEANFLRKIDRQTFLYLMEEAEAELAPAERALSQLRGRLAEIRDISG